MTIKITLIGMGKIGTSIGLALAKHTNQIYRIGHDRIPEHANLAKKMNAVDKVEYNLPASVENSDIVILALPFDQIHETVKFIASDLREGTVVMDTAPVKAPVAQWMREHLTEGRFYVGLTPVISPKYLMDIDTGGSGAHEDLFQNGTMGIVAPSGTSSAAIKLATDLITLLGAKPLFLDMVEGDSLMAGVHYLPQILAASLASITVNQPGWIEGRKLTGSYFAQVSSPLSSGDSPEALTGALQHNHESITRLIDAMIAQLTEFRALTNAEDNDVLDTLKDAREGRVQWMHERSKGNWEDQHPQSQMPSAKEEIKRWFFGRRKKDQSKPR